MSSGLHTTDMALHAHTPVLVVIDPRGLAIRNIAFCRSDLAQSVDERVARQTYDVAGRLVSQRDSRLSIDNLRTTYSLGGQVLLTESVDAGWRLGLVGDAGQFAEGWDSRGCQRRVDYDVMLRPLAITEDRQVTERFDYGGPDAFEHNQCNQLIRHDDTAGTRYLQEFDVLGAVVAETRHFLQAVEIPDWPLDEAERDALLESTRLETRWAFDPLGDPVQQTDASGNGRFFTQTVAGQLKSVDLKLAGTDQRSTLVSDIRYNAVDQIEQETTGNGVVSYSRYDPQDGRLLEIHAGSPALQHLTYAYDPVGNIQHIEDAAQPTRFFANQRVEPVSRYRYDTLYQLIEATGREVRNGASHAPALPDLQPVPADPNQIGNYTQHYDYDAAGNLLQMRHVGNQSFTRTMRVATDSNRSLPEGEIDAGFTEGFDENGNLLQLVRGQALEWDMRNHLQHITTVTRATAANDDERYVYDGHDQRCRKISSTLASGRTLINEVRYLPGLEIRTCANGQILHVVSTQAGRSNARVLHWEAGQPSGIANDQIRYSLSDHLGSSILELDQQGGLISQENYYPFGGTSWWAARSAVEATYKTVRYSGKERDASGLYYYGFRYYAPWLQRWISPDPAGDKDGLNLFRFSRNAPIVWVDPSGAQPFHFADVVDELGNSGDPVQGVGLQNIARWNPQLGGSLTVGLSFSKQGLAFARRTLNRAVSPFAAHDERETLLSHFRTTAESDDDTDTYILKVAGQRIGALSSFLQSWDSARMVGMSEDKSSRQVAWQYTNDPEHHLFMRAGPVHQDAHRAAWNIIHEASHMTLRTKDFWYMNTPGATPSGTSGADSYGGRIDILAQIQRLQLRYKGVLWDGPEDSEFDRASFMESPRQRARIILENADSIALATAFINQAFKGPLASLTVLGHQPSTADALALASVRRRERSTQRRASL